MVVSLIFVASYSLLVGVASFIEVPVGRGFGAFQLNALIRIGSLAAAAAAFVVVHGLVLPAWPSILAGFGIGLIAGVGSICYCFAIQSLPVSLVVTFSNLYLVVTIFLGIVVLGEPITPLKLAGIAAMLIGVLLLAQAPTRYGVHHERNVKNQQRPMPAIAIMAAYIVIVGVGAFLEKPALTILDPTQLNALMGIGMTTVAASALAAWGPRLRLENRALGAIGIGAMIGVASVLYFLGLRGLPVSAASALSNSSMVVPVFLSAVFLHQPITRARGGAIGLTLLGATLLARSTS